MAVTQTQLDAMVAAYASGTASVSYDGRTVTYRSLDALLAAIGRVADALGVTNPLAPAAAAPKRYRLAAYRRG